MVKTYDKTGLCILTPETIREAVILKYENKLFMLDMIDYQTFKQKEAAQEISSYLKQLKALYK